MRSNSVLRHLTTVECHQLIPDSFVIPEQGIELTVIISGSMPTSGFTYHSPLCLFFIRNELIIPPMPWILIGSLVAIVYTSGKLSNRLVSTRRNNGQRNGRMQNQGLDERLNQYFALFSYGRRPGRVRHSSVIFTLVFPSIFYPFFNSSKASFPNCRTRDIVHRVYPYRKVHKKMRIFYSLRRLMSDIYIFLLFSSVFTLASPFDSVPQNVASLFRRSIPGSLGWAPAGAVGYYQPPPGPIAKPPVPTETKAASTSASEITHELRRQLVTETGTVPR